MSYETYTIAESVTVSNTATNQFKALYVGTGGNVVVESYNSGDTVTFYNVPSGTVLPIKTAKVRNTGTSATGIVGLH
tara:strand:- start:592 stop:822 length:231 start_codon:yes stop_codon:yes gene_type:complete